MNRRDFLFSSGAALTLALAPRSALFAQTATPLPAAPVPVPVKPPTPVTKFELLRNDVGYFTGRGGTIGWMVSPEALIAIDTQFPDTAAIFMQEVPARGGRKFDAVINTHHHLDHTGGNKVFQPATQRIVGQQNVPALQAAAFARNPKIGEQTPPDTLFADTWRIDAGKEVVNARYFGPAHTGGDIAVHFERANIVHVGDLVFHKLYPVTDRPGGSQVRHWIKVVEEVAQTYPADALYVFGHGRQNAVVGSRQDVLAQRDFLSALVDHVEKAIAAGHSREEITQLVNLPGFPDYEADAKTSRLPGNLGAVYDELNGRPSGA